jgi:hypothetical protein
MRFFLLLAATAVFYSCEVKVNTPQSAGKAGAGKIRNGIKLNAKGVTVEQAFLTYEDGSLVDESNTTSVNRKIKINFVVSGWKEEDGKVALEANEKVTTSDGDVIMDEKELFSGGGLTTVSAEDAQFPRLSVVVNQVNKLYDFYLVSFRIWNRGTDQSIEGEYKFYIN